MAEVEAQAIRGDERAALLDMRAEAATQGGMEQVGGRVRPADGVTAGAIDAGGGALADVRRALHDLTAMHDQAAERPARILNLDAPAIVGAADHAGIADLAAGFHVEGRARQDNLNPLTGDGRVDRMPVLDQGQHLALDFQRAIRIMGDAG